MKRRRIYGASLNPPLLASESPDEFDSIRSAIIAQLRPGDFIEKLFVSDAIVLRLGRLPPPPRQDRNCEFGLP
jgi:hypothetical protein